MEPMRAFSEERRPELHAQ